MSKLLSCFWNVSINGELLDMRRKKCIESIDIEELCDGSDTCTINLSDPDFLFIEDNIFIEDATITVKIGWHGDTSRVKFTGYISAIDIDFPENGYPTVSVFCLDNSYVMNKVKWSRSWDKCTRAEVVEKIAKNYGFKCVIEPGYSGDVEETISQSNSTNLEFCEKLASEEREPYMCKLIGDTIYYVKKGILSKPFAKLYYRENSYDVISFKPQINKGTQKVEASDADILIVDKSVDSAVANSDNTQRDNQGEPVKTTAPTPYYKLNTETETWGKEVK